MKYAHASLILLSTVVLGALSAHPNLVSASTPERHVDFNRDIRPILAENCLTCHGPDGAQRKAGLRLDTSDGAAMKLPSGNRAIVPGKLDQSGLAIRIEAKGPMQMPPAASGKKLSPFQIETLKLWVKQGGSYEEHWAFIPPKRPAIPAVKLKSWALNPIDNFILARLEKEGLKPSPTTDRVTLARRLYFDLTGLLL